jgi:hypothetical protein
MEWKEKQFDYLVAFNNFIFDVSLDDRLRALLHTSSSHRGIVTLETVSFVFLFYKNTAACKERIESSNFPHLMLRDILFLEPIGD